MAVNKNVLQSAQKAIDKFEPREASRFLRGMASVDPQGETSKALRAAAIEIEAGTDPKKIKIHG